MSDICICGAIKGENQNCSRCKLSKSLRKRWENPSHKMIEAAKKPRNRGRGLFTKQAAEKRKAYFSSDLHKQRASENGKKVWEKRKRKELPQSLIPISDTKPELAVESVLQSLDIRYKKQCEFGPYIFDFYLADYKILLEVQGRYWHSQPQNISRDIAKQAFISNNYQSLKLYYIDDLETIKKGAIEKFLRKITDKNIKQITINIHNLECKTIPIQIANEFFHRFHYLPKFRKNSKFIYGVYNSNLLIASLVYAHPSYNTVCKKHGQPISKILELARFAIHDKYHVKNLASWAISQTIKLLKKESDATLLVSFADPHFGYSGSIYKASNWEYDGETRPSYYYVDRNKCIIHKKTIWDYATKMGSKESDYAIANSLTKINTEPKKRFIYWLNAPICRPKVKTTAPKTKCLLCGNEFEASHKALQRAIHKHGGYMCHSCSIKESWNKGIYNNRTNSNINWDKIIEAICECGTHNKIKLKSYRNNISKNNKYKCHKCAIKGQLELS